MEKILVFRDEYRINEELAELKKYIESIQGIFEELAAISKNGLKDNNDLGLLYRNPKAFFIKLLVVEEDSLQGFSLSKGKVFDLLELPDSVNHLIEKFSQNSADRRENDRIRRNLAQSDGIYLTKLEILNQKVQIQESYLKDLEDKYSIYITNENQQILWNKLHEISEILSEIPQIVSQVTSKYPLSLKDLEKLFKVDYSGYPIIGDGNFIPDPKILKSIK